MKNECYYCGIRLDKATRSKEHIPPKQMFRGFSCDRITVPSCPVHNTNKGDRDAAILRGMLISLDVKPDRDSLNPDVLKAIEDARPYFHEVKRQVTVGPAIKNPPKELDTSAAYLLNSRADIDSWIRQLTAGLVYSALGRKVPSFRWDEARVFSSSAFGMAEPNGEDFDLVRQRAELNEQRIQLFTALPWQSGWNKRGRIVYPASLFRFQLLPCCEFAALYLVFFDDFEWTVVFKAEQSVIEELSG